MIGLGFYNLFGVGLENEIYHGTLRHEVFHEFSPWLVYCPQSIVYRYICARFTRQLPFSVARQRSKSTA